MKLTTRGRYALTALMELAEYNGKTPITLTLIAERQNLSVSYLEFLFSRLKHNRLVRSVRGPGGGYILAQAPRDISVAQVICAVDSSLLVMDNSDRDSTSGASQCNIVSFLDQYLWHDINQKIYSYLNDITLHDLLMQHGGNSTARMHSQKRPSIPALMNSIMPYLTQTQQETKDRTFGSPPI